MQQWEREKENGIDHAYRGASQVWKDHAEHAARLCARNEPLFTSTTVYLHMSPEVRDLCKGQAFAGVLRRLQSEGVIAPTGEFRNEKRARNHGRPQRVWMSRVYEGDE